METCIALKFELYWKKASAYAYVTSNHNNDISNEKEYINSDCSFVNMRSKGIIDNSYVWLNFDVM